MDKTYRGDLLKFHEMLKEEKPFSFCKFSDGELFILQNKELILSESAHHHSYKSLYDHKHFDPKTHGFYRDKLFESLRYISPNYYVGLPVSQNWGKEVFEWLKKESGKDEEHLTWANLMVNSNYLTYRDLFLPEYAKYPVVLVCSKFADINKIPFTVVKDFRVGPNCIINDYGLIEEIKNWIIEKKVDKHLFLFAASSLGNYMAHQLNELNPNNTYIDVGSTLNPELGLNLDRGYLAAAFGVPWRGTDTSNDLKQEEPWG